MVDSLRYHRFGIVKYVLHCWRTKNRLRRWKLTLGEKSRIDLPFFILYGQNISIGRNCVVGTNAFLVAGPNSSITMGDDVLLAPNVHINTTMHNYDNPDVPIRLQGGSEKDVRIGRDVWIGTGAIILQGVEIGEGAVVGAGAVVNKRVEPFSVVAGVPAKEIKKRKQSPTKRVF